VLFGEELSAFYLKDSLAHSYNVIRVQAVRRVSEYVCKSEMLA